MRKLLITMATLFAVLVAVPSLALDAGDISADFNNLSPEAKLKILGAVQKETRAATNATSIVGAVTPEKVEKWAILVDHIGAGMAKLAKELGTTANELINTPVGMITVGLVAYSVMGENLLDHFLGIILGIGFFCTFFPIWLFMFYKTVIPVINHERITTTARFSGKPIEVDSPVRRAIFSGEGGPGIVSIIFLIVILLGTCIFVA